MAIDEPEDRNLRTLARWRQTGRVLVEALPVSCLFIAVMLGIACWRFSSADF